MGNHLKTNLVLIVLLSALLPAMLLAASPALAEEPAPRIELSEYSWHFGTHPQETTLYRDLVIYNNGTAPLEVWDVEPTCGCTVLDRGQYPLVIPPGGSHTVNVSFNTLHYQGDVWKYIVVKSSDPARSTITVDFWCTVVVTQPPGMAITFTIQTSTTETETTTTTYSQDITTQSPAAAIPLSVIAIGFAVIKLQKLGKR